MKTLLESFLAIVPVFLLILLGYLLRKRFKFTEVFVSKASWIQFYIALPSLVLINLIETDFTQIFDGPFVLSILVATAVIFFLALIFSLFIKRADQKGPFIQGSYRANMFIIGLALVLNVAGDKYGAMIVAMLAIIMPIYNILAIIVLSLFVHDSDQHPFISITKKIFLNPLIWAVIIAFIIKLLVIPVPQFLLISLGYLKNLALPLGLLTIGMSLRFRAIGNNWKILVNTALLKLILYPILAVFFASLLGIEQDLWIPIFLVCGAPTAIASFAMTKAMKNDSELAAQIIAINTALSIVTLTFGVSFLDSIP